MPPGNDECGNKCPEGEKSNGFCGECPVKEAEDNFKEFVANDLKEKLKQDWQKYSFDSLYRTVLDVLDFEDLPKSERTIKTNCLVNILKSARNRIERIDRFNNRQTSEK